MSTLTALSLNAWFDNEESFTSIREIILKERPDIVGLQEYSLESAARLALVCNMYCSGHPRNWQPVLSRWPLESLGEHGFRVCIPDGIALLLYNVHLPSLPYAPYALHKCYTPMIDPCEDPFVLLGDELELCLDTDESTPSTRASVGDVGFASLLDDETNPDHAEAVRVERNTQLPSLIDTLRHSDLQCDAHDSVEYGIVLMGDFNAASHLDYPDGPSWPCSMLCASHGLLDSFAEATRLGFAAREPANTWAAKEDQEPRGIHDRIDFVYTSDVLKVSSSMHLDGSNCIKNWPSDHRAVLSVFKLP